MKYIFIFLFILPLYAFSQDSVKINKNNWVNHPKIKAIRTIVNEIEDDIKKGNLKETKKDFEYCIPYEDTERKIYTDKNNRVLKYIKAGGSDDSAMKWSFYYDAEGNLIFTYIEAGAVNNANFEGRIYLSKDKTRLWEAYGYTTKEEYTFQYPVKDGELIFNPDSAFESTVECK